ncbi:hypothetical protein E8E13_008738 [Curvularia kusanoi]|uniref:2EXR domain-containing protein n=1 Tax=Curvularia kusanoi TaxID=90978 RepID=A0A9P4WA71_CURKU|nr:hypothetical protein E8E13_008738 [Curvularia kusanoi]
MATFHPFPRLPLEIRIQIWECFADENRVLKIRKLHLKEYWSPTPVPAITRACRESRKYCSYTKRFAADGKLKYIWVDFKSDIIQMHGSLVSELVEEKGLEVSEIRHLRVDLIDEDGWDEHLWFYHRFAFKTENFPALQSLSVFINKVAVEWLHFVTTTDPKPPFSGIYWVPCSPEEIEFVDDKSRE